MSVIIYTTPSCHFCHIAIEFFKQNKVKYEEYDVSKDRERAEEMIEKSGQLAVPVIDIDGVIIVGFNQPAIKKALNLK